MAQLFGISKCSGCNEMLAMENCIFISIFFRLLSVSLSMLGKCSETTELVANAGMQFKKRALHPHLRDNSLEFIEFPHNKKTKTDIQIILE